MNASIAKNDQPLVMLTDVSVNLNGKKLFESISFNLRPGTITLLQGSNGVGKTTLLRTIAGLHKNYRGIITRKSHEAKIALVSSACSFMYEALSLRENLELIGDASKTATLIDGDLFGPILMDQPLSSLSSGERSIAAFIRGLAGNSDVILLDEITSHLDESRRGIVFDQLRARVASGCAVLLVSHDALGSQKFDTRLTLNTSGLSEGVAHG